MLEGENCTQATNLDLVTFVPQVVSDLIEVRARCGEGCCALRRLSYCSQISTFVLAEFLGENCPVDSVFTMCRRTEQTSSSSIQAS